MIPLPLSIYFGLTIIALILSIFNTIILYRRKMISSSDLKDLIQIVQLVMDVAGINDEKVKELLQKLLEKYS